MGTWSRHAHRSSQSKGQDNYALAYTHSTNFVPYPTPTPLFHLLSCLFFFFDSFLFVNMRLKYNIICTIFFNFFLSSSIQRFECIWYCCYTTYQCCMCMKSDVPTNHGFGLTIKVERQKKVEDYMFSCNIKKGLPNFWWLYIIEKGNQFDDSFLNYWGLQN